MTAFLLQGDVVAIGVSSVYAIASVWMGRLVPTPSEFKCIGNKRNPAKGTGLTSSVELAASVKGEGPPLILLHGLFAAGDTLGGIRRRMVSSTRFTAWTSETMAIHPTPTA